MVSYTVTLLFVFCAVWHNNCIYAVRIKVALSSDDAKLDHPSVTAGRLRRQSNYCSQVSLVSREMLNSPPYNEIPADTISGLDSRVKFYYIAAEIVNDLQNRHVPSNGLLVRDIMSVLERSGCFPFFYGGVVRDIFLNAADVTDVDLEADCPIEKVLTICTHSFFGQCSINGQQTIVHIGIVADDPDDAIDVASTNVTFYGENSLLNLEYNRELFGS